MVLVYLMQAFLEGQQEPWCKRGKLLLLACQKFGTEVNFCRNNVPSINTNPQLDLNHQSMQDGYKKGNFEVQDEFLCPLDCMNYIVLFKITHTDTGPQSRVMLGVQYFNVLNCFLTTLYDLKLPCNMREPASLCCMEMTLYGDLFVTQIVLEIIRTIQVKFFLM